MVAGRPDAESLIGQLTAATGSEVAELWEENVPTVQLFDDMSTQWHMGPGGRAGLRYEALPFLMRLRGIAPAERSEIFNGLQVMERAALEAIHGDH